MDFYRGKAVYISGGSSGIGLAAARQLAGAGASVAISARGQERLASALEELKRAAKGPEQKFHAIACDVSDPKECERAKDETLAALGKCDVVVANAGIAHAGRVQETPAEMYERMMRINYLGYVHTIRAFLPHLFERKQGSIGLVVSSLGFMGIYGYSAYAPTKFAQVGFAECLRHECLDYGVSVTMLFPYDTDTPQHADEQKAMPEETKALAGEVKCMSADAVATELLEGIACGKARVVSGGAMGGITYLAKRLSPGFMDWTTDGMLKKYRRAHPL